MLKAKIFLAVLVFATVVYIIYDQNYAYHPYSDEETEEYDEEISNAMEKEEASLEEEASSEEEYTYDKSEEEMVGAEIDKMLSEQEAQSRTSQSKTSQSRKIICPKCDGTGEGTTECDFEGRLGQCKGLGGWYYDGDWKTCYGCQGKGTLKTPCSVCHGKGRVNEYE